ncbi:hypothetical protein PENSPDRAFT_257308 [Peniophora sp. CONT]|nr:hypothetical protein PENSPDRAFT_257308 [Peniophora sp. CONT]
MRLWDLMALFDRPQRRGYPPVSPFTYHDVSFTPPLQSQGNVPSCFFALPPEERTSEVSFRGCTRAFCKHSRGVVSSLTSRRAASPVFKDNYDRSHATFKHVTAAIVDLTCQSDFQDEYLRENERNTFGPSCNRHVARSACSRSTRSSTGVSTRGGLSRHRHASRELYCKFHAAGPTASLPVQRTDGIKSAPMRSRVYISFSRLSHAARAPTTPLWLRVESFSASRSKGRICQQLLRLSVCAAQCSDSYTGILRLTGLHLSEK